MMDEKWIVGLNFNRQNLINKLTHTEPLIQTKQKIVKTTRGVPGAKVFIGYVKKIPHYFILNCTYIQTNNSLLKLTKLFEKQEKITKTELKH